MYRENKEIVLFGVDKDLLTPFVPEIKIRMNKGKVFDLQKVSSSRDVYEILKRIYGRNPVQENFIVLLLNRANRLIGYYRHTVGSSYATIVDVPMIVAMSTKALAHGVVVSHNHPSGNLSPSDADREMTKNLKRALTSVGINLLDHIIFTTTGHYSFADDGVLDGIKNSAMITTSNLISEYPGIDQSILPEALKKKEFEFIKENIDLYNEDETIKKYIDTFVLKLNEVVSKQSKQADKKKVEKHKSEKTKSVKPVSAKKEIQADAKFIEKIEPEIVFIKRYVNLHGKEKTKDQILTLLKSLQKAITERQIRKTSKYSKEIEHIQANLVKVINSMGSSIRITIAENQLEHLSKLAESEKTCPAVLLIKRFLAIQGKTGVKEKAEKLLSDIENKLSSLNKASEPLLDKLDAVTSSLKSYLKGQTSSPIVSTSELNGLMNCSSQVHFQKQSKTDIKPGKIISSSALSGVNFTLLGFTGKWLSLIGNPSEPFSIMIYGEPGSYKSTLGLLFANYLAKTHNKKVLFVAHEEKVGQKIQEKLDRLNASHKNLDLVDELPKEIGTYDFIFIDTVNSHNLEPQDLQELRRKNPKVSFVYIFQTTKEGKFRGSKEYEHDVDVVIKVENGMAKAEKNRFGGKEQIKVI